MLPDGPLSVELRDVNFAYEPGDPVLQDITLSLEPGEVLGLLGRTGGGKTTIGRLLVRLYDIDEGAISSSAASPCARRRSPICEPRRRRQPGRADLRRHRARQPHLLRRLDAGRPELLVGARRPRACASGWRPGGLDTCRREPALGRRGAAPGLRPRLPARPGLVILDEATSRLDPATQRLVDARDGPPARGPHGDHDRPPPRDHRPRRPDCRPRGWPRRRGRRYACLLADLARASTPAPPGCGGVAGMSMTRSCGVWSPSSRWLYAANIVRLER